MAQSSWKSKQTRVEERTWVGQQEHQYRIRRTSCTSWLLIINQDLYYQGFQLAKGEREMQWTLLFRRGVALLKYQLFKIYSKFQNIKREDYFDLTEQKSVIIAEFIDNWCKIFDQKIHMKNLLMICFYWTFPQFQTLHAALSISSFGCSK